MPPYSHEYAPIALRCNFMPIPAGTVCYYPVVVNHNRIYTTRANFAYEMDFTQFYAGDYVFRSNILSASNVAVYDVVADAQLTKYVYIDTVNNVMIVAWDDVTSTIADKLLWICVGPTVAAANSSAAWTNSGYTNKWIQSEPSSGNPNDYIAAHNLTKVAPLTGGYLGGPFGRTHCANGSGYMWAGTTPVGRMGGLSLWTYEFIIQKDNTVGSQLVCYRPSAVNGSAMYFLYPPLGTDEFRWNENNGVGNSGTVFYPTSGLANYQFFHFVCSYDGTQAIPADRCKIYVDGVNLPPNGVGGVIPITLDTFNQPFYQLGYSSGSFGNSGCMNSSGMIPNIAETPTWSATRYAMYFGGIGDFYLVGGRVGGRALDLMPVFM